MHIFHIVIDSNQDKEDQEEMEPEENQESDYHKTQENSYFS